MNGCKSEIKNLWRIIATGPNSILELRAIWPEGITPTQYAITKCFHAVEYESLDACRKAVEFEAISLNAGITVHVSVLDGRDPHHIAEAEFKAFARAFRKAVEIDSRVEGIPSTKGAL